MIAERPLKAPPTAFYAWLTVERALYGILVLLAAGLRLGWLTSQPFNSTEAGHAWSAWLTVSGGQPELAMAPDSPLLSSLYTFFFWALGATDTLARGVPALCGVGLVILLWYWRSWLGRTVALFAALLIAIDPWLVAYSRLADSAMLSLLLAMLALTGLAQLAATEDIAAPTHWHTMTAASLGLLLVSGPQSWSLWVVLAFFVWFCLADFPLLAWLRQPRVWIVVITAAVLGATGWLARPAGLSAISTSLTVWLSQLTGAGTPFIYSLNWVVWRLVLEQPFALLFGLLGLGVYWSHRGRDLTDYARFNAPVSIQARSPARGVEPQGWLRFLSIWLLWGGFLMLAPGRTPLVLGLFSLPLTLLAAYGLLLLVQQASGGVAWREDGLLCGVLTILFVSFAIWVSALTNSPTFDSVLARTLLIILVLMFLIVLAYTLWLDGRQARLTTGALLAVLLLACTISSSWQLNQRFDVAYPDGFFATATNPDVRRLAADLQMLSAQRRGDAGELPVQVQMAEVPDPVLGWYLREMRNLTWVLAPGLVDGQSPSVVVTLSEDGAVSGLTASYLGSQYALRDPWLPAMLTTGELSQASATEGLGFGARLQERLNTLWAARVRTLLRWLIYREAPVTPASDTVVLWVMAGDGQ